MRKGITALIILAVLLSLVGCSATKQTLATTNVKPVKVMVVKDEKYPETLDYVGIVGMESTKKYSFKSSGKIDAIFVKKGQEIKKGDKLAQLDTKDLNYSVQVAQSQLNSVQAQYDNAIKGTPVEKIKQAELNLNKAEEAFHFANNTYEDLKNLYDSGVIAKQDLDKAELEMKLRKSDMEIATEVLQEAKNGVNDENRKALLSQVEQARTNYEYQKSTIKDATLSSDVNGYVVDVLFEPGEIIGAGYPVVIVRNDHSVVNVGLTQEDVERVKTEMKALIKANDKVIEGVVTSIDAIPDQTTRTYNVKIELREESFRIGTIAKVTIYLGETNGILVPINSILKNGETYVYIVENDLAVKKEIILGQAFGSDIFVDGLSSGDKVVIEGIKALTNGDSVKIKP